MNKKKLIYIHLDFVEFQDIFVIPPGPHTDNKMESMSISCKKQSGETVDLKFNARRHEGDHIFLRIDESLLFDLTLRPIFKQIQKEGIMTYIGKVTPEEPPALH